MAAPPVLDVVGREAELGVVRGILEAVAELPRAILIEGEAGIGKTTVWRAGVAAAEELGYRVLTVAPAENEQDLSYSGLVDLLGGVRRDVVGALPAPQRRALEVALLQADSRGRPPAGHAVPAAARGVIAELASAAPLVVAVDDAHWLDLPSATALTFAARRVADLPVALLVTVRSDHAEDWASLDRGLPLTRLQLGPMSLGALGRMLRLRLGAALPRPSLRRLHALSGGNPLHALELARAGAAKDLDTLAVPTQLRRLVERRVFGLPTATQRALVLASLAAHPTVELVAAALEETVDLSPAVEAELVSLPSGRIQFAHPLLAAAVAQLLSPEEQRAAHARLADVVTTAEEHAQHLSRARDAPDEEVAAMLESAAASASARGAAASALDLLERAVLMTPPQDHDAWLRRSLAGSRAARAAGDLARGSSLAAAAVERARPGEERAAAVVELVSCATRPMADVAEAAVEEAGSNPELKARLWLMAADHLFLSDLGGAARAAEVAAEEAERAGDRGLHASALTLLGFTAAARGEADAVDRLRRAAAIAEEEDVSVYFSPSANLAVVLLWRDELSEARVLLGDALERGRRDGDEYATAWALVHMAQLEWRGGDLHAAARFAADALALWERSGDEHGRSIALWAGAAIDAAAGRFEDAVDAARAGLGLDLEDRLFPARQHAVLGYVAFCRDDFASALQHFSETRTLLDDYGAVDPGLVLYAGEELETFVRLGRLGDAQACIDRLREQGKRLERPRLLALAARGEGLVASERMDIDGAIDGYERALDEHERCEYELDRGRTLMAYGTALRKARRQADARTRLRQAVDLFDGLGAAFWRDRAASELQRVPGRSRGAGLTPAERRVARLVALGRTNKEVAAELVVSVKAVEANLSRVYAKLGIRSRTELARMFPNL